MRPHDGLGPAQEQDPARAEGSYKAVKDALLGRFGEVDNHVAAGDEIERATRVRIAKQVVPGEADTSAGGWRDAESGIAGRHEPAAATLGAYVADVAREIAGSRSGAIEDGLVNIRGEHGMAMARPDLLEQNRQ